ncbi:autotransporter-associated beta strand repeat-containing protein [Termitidicoccus mucosus]|uniref:autotransporter-associated beta strand repeat-containing protein n=1 Tax=Termitidicoccus mucosus TaxID=1184151 RepID=UPI003183CCDF
MNIALRILRLTASMLLASGLLHAQTSGTFTGTGPAWDWADAANWSSAAAPGSAAGDSAVLNAAANTALAGRTLSLTGAGAPGGVTLGSLAVTGGAGVGASGTLTIGAAASPSLLFDTGVPGAPATLSLSGGAALRILADVSAAADLAINNNSAVLGSIVLGGAATVAGQALFNISDADGSITVAGPFAAASLVKNGAGALRLDSANAAIAGNVSFNAGSIVVGADNALGTGALVLNAPAALRLNLAGSDAAPAQNRSLANSIDLSTTDLIVGRADQATATALRTLSLNPAAAAVSALGSGTRVITVDPLTGLAFGANQSFSGGTLLKQGGGVLTLAGAQSTFQKFDIQLGTVRGELASDMTLGAGPSILGAGNINVSGGNTVLELTASNPAATLTLGAGASITLSDYATFRLSGGGLALLGGTIDLGGTGLLDYGAGTVTLGSTQILNAPASGLNFGGNLVFTDLTGIISAAAHRLNLIGAGTQTLSYNDAGPGNVSVAATVVKTGPGETILDASINSLVFSTGGGLVLQSGTLSLGKAGQYSAGSAATTFTGGTAVLALRGFDQASMGTVVIAPAAAATFAFGGDIATSTTLGLGNIVFGSASLLRIRDYTNAALSAAPDTLTAVNAPSLTAAELSQIWFHGYNKGAALINTNELAPVTLLDSTWSGAGGTFDWRTAANWVGGDPFNIPDSPGATARITALGGPFAQKTFNLGGTVTLGRLLVSVGGDWSMGGTLVFDSGDPATAAVISSAGASFYTPNSVILKSDLRKIGAANIYVGSLISDDYAASGIRRKVIVEQGSWSPYNVASSYSGGTELRDGTVTRLHLTHTNGIVAGNFLGTGTIWISPDNPAGTASLYSMHMGNSTPGGAVRLDNPIVLTGNLNTGAIYYNYSGAVELTGTRTINIGSNTISQDWVSSAYSVVFGAGFDFTGTGALRLTGAYGRRIAGDHNGLNTFSGGLYNGGSHLWITGLNKDLVVGELDPGHNYLGSGDVTIDSPIYINGTGKIILKGSLLTINGAITFGYAPEGGMWLSGGTVAGTGMLRADRDLYFDGSVVNSTVGLQFLSNLTNRVYSTANNPLGGVGGTVSVGYVTKGETSVRIIDASVGLLDVGDYISVTGGILRLDADNQIKAANLILNGGVFDTAGHTLGYTGTGAGDHGIRTLTLAGDSSLSVGAGGITFDRVNTTGWSLASQLILQNDGSSWVASGTGSHLRFLTDISTLFNAANWSTILDNIAFTGYENGAQLSALTGGYYYLIPDAATTNEWSGGSAANWLWSDPANWRAGTHPAAAGASASIRDLDPRLAAATRTIDVDGDYTIGSLNLQSSYALNLGGAGKLIFSNTGGLNASVKVAGQARTIGAAWQLDSDTDLTHSVSYNAGVLTLNNALTGAGDLIVRSGVAQSLLVLQGNNAAWSGDLVWKDPRVIFGLTGAAGAPLAGTGRFLIGETAADAAGTYRIEARTAARTAILAGGYELWGNLTLQSPVNTTNQYNNLTLDGTGLLAGTGTRTITVAGTAEQRPVLRLTGAITGAAGLLKTGLGQLRLDSTNTFVGDFVWSQGGLQLYADNALGTGVFRMNASGEPATINLGGGTRVLDNPFVITAGITPVFTGGTLVFDADSSLVGSSTLNGTWTPRGGALVVFGKNHVIEGTGGFGNTNGGKNLRFLGGDNTFTGGLSMDNVSASTIEIGASSTQDGAGVVTAGPIGVGTFTTNVNARLAVYSDDALVTTHILGNTVNLSGGNGIIFGKSAAAENTADTLVLSAGTLALAQNNDTAFNIGAGATLRVDSKITDGAAGRQLVKTGDGVLELDNTANEISAGIQARAGIVRDRVTGASVTVGGGAPTAFGTGPLSTYAASGDAGAFEIAADDGAFVTIAGNNAFLLNDNGALRVTGNGVTTILGAGGSLVSTSAAGREGRLVADYVQTTDYTLGVKLAAQHWELGAGTVQLTRANLLNTTGTITLAAGAVLDIQKNTQLIQNLIVNGNAAIDVTGDGNPQTPVVLTLGNITVNGGLLTFAGWQGDPGTGLGATILKSTLSAGRVITGVSLQAGSDVVRVVRNTQGENVLLPYADLFTWDGTYNNIWTTDNWSKSTGHSLVEQPDSNTATATFHTGSAALAGATITLDADKTLTGLFFEGADKEDFTIDGNGYRLTLDSDQTGPNVATTLQNTGVSDVTLDVGLRISYGSDSYGRGLDIVQDGAGALIFNQQLSGIEATVTVSGTGAGAVVFNAQNTFSKAFVLESGNVWLGIDGDATGGPLGHGVITLQSGALRGVTVAPGSEGNPAAYTDADRVLERPYLLDGGFAKAGTRALVLHGTGTLASDSTVTVADASGTLILGTAAHELALGAHTLTAAGPGVTRLDGALTGAGHLEQTGPGALIVNAASRHTGTTTIAAGGTLALAAANAIASSTSVVVDGVLTTTGTQTLNNLAGTAATADILIPGGTIGANDVLALRNTRDTVYAGAITSGSGYTSVVKTGTGTLTLTGSSDLAAGTVNSALSTTSGRVAVDEGALVLTGSGRMSDAYAEIGSAAGTSGTLLVNSGAVWEGSLVIVGSSGAGVLVLTDTAVIRTRGANIGSEASAAGVADVTGSGHWEVTDGFRVGSAGSGTLRITQSGSVRVGSSQEFEIGGPAGFVSVGDDGLLDVDTYIVVGGGIGGTLADGSGTLSLTGSGRVRAGNLFIGSSATGSGTGAVLAGGDSRLESGGFVMVGHTENNTGTLDISGHAVVGGTYGGLVGLGTNAVGAATVRDDGLWESGSAFVVGFWGSGTLAIADRAIVRVGGDSFVGGGAIIDYSDPLQPAYTGHGSGAATVSGTALWDTAGNFHNGYTDAGGTGAGSLSIAGSGSVAVGGTYFQNAGSSLALTLPASGTRGAFITAGSGTLGGALVIAGYTAPATGTTALEVLASATTHTLIHAAGGTLAGDFASVTGGTGAGTPDYIYQGVHKTADGRDYNLAHGLSWQIGGTRAHGDFTVASGSAFDVNIALSDTAGHAGWTGDTLTKKGDGLLILSASNAYSGTTLVTAGTLRATDAGAFGSSRLDVSSAALAELSGLTGTLVNALAGTGTLRVAGGSDLDYRGAATAWDGDTRVDSGLLRVNSLLGSAASALTVSAGGTLGGSGTLGGLVMVNAGGHLAPGNSAGTLSTAGDLVLTGAILDFELNAITNPGHNPVPGNDLVNVGGDLVLAGTSTLNITSTGAALAKGEYDLIHYGTAGTGTLSGGAANIALGVFNGTSVSTLADAPKYLVSTAETGWVKLLYDFGYFAHWDGGDSSKWTNTGDPDGGSGTWYAPGANSAYTAWSGSNGAPNGEWLGSPPEDAGFAIFGGTAGTVTVDNTPAGSFTGGTIHFSGAQFKVDGYLLTGGTLTTGGTDAVVFNMTAGATIATTLTGTHAIEKAGAGTLTLAGANTTTGTIGILDGALVMTHTGALGAGAVVVGAGAGATTKTLRVSTGDIVFASTLSGTGLLHVDLGSSTSTFNFNSSAAGAGFTGTALFETSAYALDNDALAGAAVVLGTANTTTVATGTQRLASSNTNGLTIDGANVIFAYTTGSRADGVILTDTLDGVSGTITITNTTTALTGTTGLLDKNLLRQDEATLVRLVTAFVTTGTNLALAGGGTTTAAVRDAGSTVTATAIYTQALDYTNGLSVNYALTQLDLLANQTTTLSGDDTAAPAGGADFTAQITGAGNLAIAATSAITLSASNAHTGTTTITSGTVIAGADDALGQTSFLSLESLASFDLNTHSQTLASGSIGGKLLGAASGSLDVTGLLEITSTNAGFAANVGVTGTTTLRNTQALGDTGTLTAGGLVRLDGATGTLAKTIAGTGTVALANSSSVALTGVNTLASGGRWTVAVGSALRASSTANLGAADILFDGMLTVANTANETLGNALSGSGAFVKEAAGNLTISQSNAFAGTSTVAGGTLTLQNLFGTGTGAVANNATLDLAGTGAFANALSGTGVTIASGGVSLRGANTGFTGTLAVTGTADITANTQIGGTGATGAKVVIAAGGELATTATTFVHALTGSGVLAVNASANGGVFDFETASGTAFAGTVKLDATTLHLGTSAAHDHNALALANAKLRVLAGSTLAANAETRKLGGLDLGAGGVTLLDMTGVAPTEVLRTGTLWVDSAAKVAFKGYANSGTVDSTGADPAKNFLDQDSINDTATLLVAADTLAPGSGNKQIAITTESGSALAGGRQIDYGNVVASYDYTGVTASASTAFSVVGSATAGLYYNYALTVLDIKSGTTLTLTTAGATDHTLAAEITGSGNLELIAGTGNLTLSHSNSYTGTTTIASGTVIAGADDALGRTAYLGYGPGAAFDLDDKTQILASGSIGGKLLGASSGSLGVTGLLDVTGTNAAFAASVGVTGTAILHNTSALGDSGTLTAGGLVRLDGATGALAKTVAGTGTVALVNSSSVALTGTNTLTADGEWTVDAGSALRASSTANLGAADILFDGLFTIANTANETLANKLAGSGTFVKEAAGNLTISQSNAFTGSAGILAGTLTLANNLDGLGTATIANSSTLALSGTGAFANTISGTGVNLVSGSVALAGTNTSFTGTLAVTGTAAITTNDNIGGTGAASASVVIARTGELATTAADFVHALTGSGLLAVTAAGGAFDFVATTGTHFAGTVALANTALTLGTNAAHAFNAAALANATLRLDAGGALHAANETRRLGGLTLDGGALWLPMNGVDPAKVLTVGTLSVADLGSTVVFENYTGGTAAISDATQQKNWLDQDNLTDNATLLVAAGTLAEAAPRQIAIHKADGSALENGQTIEHDEVFAIYNYTAQTSGSADAHTSGTLAPGLYYDYVLAELNVKTGTTLALDTTGAADNTLSAAITGDGSVTYATGSTLILTGTNTYSGASTILTGTVVAGVDSALGHTSRLDIAAPGVFDLNGRAQTVSGGGVIDGHLTGTGALTLTGGTLTVNSANPGYTAQTSIGSGATAHLANTAGLGNGGIQLDGTLRTDATGALQNTLFGYGLFHAASGTVTLASDSAGFHGTGSVAAGARVTATHENALGAAAIGAASGATFEQKNFTGVLRNTLSGAGTHLVTNATLLLDNPAAYQIANTTLDANAALVLDAGGYRFGTLNMNGGALAFSAANTTGTVTIAALGNTSGNFYLNADLSGLGGSVSGTIARAATIANFLDITNDGAGTHNVHLATNGTEPAGPNIALELIHTGGTQSTFTLVGGKIETELTSLELMRGDGSAYIPDPNMWYLTDAGLSHAADAILSTASSLALDWANALDSLHLRMGDLRAENLASLDGGNAAAIKRGSASGNVWVRSRGYRLDASNRVSGMGFEQYGYGMTAGADRTFETGAGANLLGGFIDMGGVSRKFDNSGTGETRSVGVGAYATLLHADGWFVDAVGRADRYKNGFDARAANGRVTHADYNVKGLSLSVEAGRRLQRADGWWLEPAAQASVLWLGRASYDTRATSDQRAIKVRVDDSETWQYRALLRFGRQFHGSRWHPYGKLAAVAVDSSGGGITAHGKTFNAGFDGKRVEFGLGASYRVNDLSQLYLDYEYARAAAYERPWSINLGYRRLW